MLRAVSLVALAIGCGGKQRAATVDSDCEPGRCLEDVSRIMKDRRPEMRSCYELAHAQDNTLEGRLTVNFVIDPKGDVVETSPSVRDGEIENAELFDCLSAVVSRIKFAASAAGKRTRAYHVFEFKKP
ncbi:MAG TPA: AgmX/PglI C-terminal domain-containing protein [Kofleriaceae bacterium]